MSMKRLATLLAACAIASPALAADNIAVVNGQPVSAEQADELVRMMVQQGAPDSPELRTQVREELINRAVMVQAAEAAGIADKPSVQNELDLARQSVLIRGLFADYLEKNPITEEAMKEEYDQLKEANTAQEYQAQHILVEEEEQARQLITELNDGGDFAALAKEHSKDPGSGARGGELGWAQADNYVAPFAEALRQLEPGETTTEPVQSQFGWHIIRLQDTREAEFPAFEQVKPQLEELMRQEALSEYQQSLIADADIQKSE